MEIFPLKDRILLSENESGKTTTSSGIIIDSPSGDSKTYTVVAVGPEVTKISVGNKVFIDLKHCIVVLVDGKHYAIVDEDDVLAVIA